MCEDPNEIHVAFGWDRTLTAEAFLDSTEHREVLEEVGVVGEPEVSLHDELEVDRPETPPT